MGIVKVKHHLSFPLILFMSIFFIKTGVAASIIHAPEADPHYTKVGFFDIHVCNWPDREKLFFLSLFSTYQFMDIRKIEIFSPDKKKLGELDAEKYRLITKKNKPEKRVYIRMFEIPEAAGDGWYTSLVTLKDGSVYEAKDFVIIASMGRATGMSPAHDVTLKSIPEKLTWKPVPGAKHYQVFIKNAWEKRVIYTSGLLKKPELILPEKLLEPDGYYSWRIHARDVNENSLLGDFNHGSVNTSIEFYIEE
ncbi:MAG: hypothetical protein GXP13_02100 [Gammaproteobacteria bacterium]|nr:hypothetical protein [Gammaproteobacteria bacterium]